MDLKKIIDSIVGVESFVVGNTNGMMNALLKLVPDLPIESIEDIEDMVEESINDGAIVNGDIATIYVTEDIEDRPKVGTFKYELEPIEYGSVFIKILVNQ